MSDEEPKTTLIALTYIESHPDKCRTFLGIFSTEEKAMEKMRQHMAYEKQNLPYANISEYNYYFDETELDSMCHY